MNEFNIWYEKWIHEQELTINHYTVAKAAYEAGIKCAQNEACAERQKNLDAEINTHKGNF